MSFLFPGFLFGLFALAIPVIIHLFNFRRYKKVYFTNVRFLKELKQESESKSKIKHWLILLSRLLMLTCLVLAFAQPYLPNKNTKLISGKKALSVYVDNSFSMEAVSKSGYLLDIAKTKVRELVKAFGAADRYQLLTNDFEGKHQRLLSREEFLQQLDEVKLSPAFKNMDEVYMRQKDILDQSECADRRNFIVSDFQKTLLNAVPQKRDTSILTTLIPLNPNKGDNVFIDTIWFESPVRQLETVQKLHVRIQNKSSKDIDNSAIRLIINEKLITPASFNVAAGEQVEVVLTYKIRETGIQQARVEIDDHPVTYDDKIYFSYTVNKRLPVLLINGDQNRAGFRLRSLLQSDSLFVLTENSDKAIDFSRFSSNNLIILNEVRQVSDGAVQELKKFVNEGGSLAIFPAADVDLNAWNKFLLSMGLNTFSARDTTDQNCERINQDQGFYADVFEKKQNNVDLPKVFSHYTVTKATRTTEENLLKLMNGMPMLSLYSFSKGKIYLCNTSLDDNWSNFSRHAIFVPSIYKMTINSELPRPLYYKTDKNSSVELKKTEMTKEQIFQLVSSDRSTEFIPEIRVGESKVNLFLQGNVKKSGNYFLNFNKEAVSGLSFNYPREESVLEYFSTDELRKLCESGSLRGCNMLEPSEKSVHLSLAENEGGAKLWKLFIILTLVFVAVEIALIRLLK